MTLTQQIIHCNRQSNTTENKQTKRIQEKFSVTIPGQALTNGFSPCSQNLSMQVADFFNQVRGSRNRFLHYLPFFVQLNLLLYKHNAEQ